MIQVAKSADRFNQATSMNKAADLPNTLRVALADAVNLQTRARNAKWNVTGADFPAYQGLFSDMGWDTSDMVDALAKAVRSQGQFAPLLLADVAALTSLTEQAGSTTDASSLAGDLLIAFQGTLLSLNAAVAAAVAYNQQAVADVLTYQVGRLQEWIWKLSAATDTSA